MELLAFTGDLIGHILFLIGILIMFVLSVTCYESKCTITLEEENKLILKETIDTQESSK